jgi:hypothetical protein
LKLSLLSGGSTGRKSYMPVANVHLFLPTTVEK